MTSNNTPFNLTTKYLAIILFPHLHNEICLFSSKDLGLFDFGDIKDRNALLKEMKSFLEDPICSITLRKISDTKLKKLRRNWTIHPSRLNSYPYGKEIEFPTTPLLKHPQTSTIYIPWYIIFFRLFINILKMLQP